MFIDLIAALTVVGFILGLAAVVCLTAERKPSKPRGRKAGKLDCWL